MYYKLSTLTKNVSVTTVFLLSTNILKASCYERYYSKAHLETYKNQQIRDVQLSWNISYEGNDLNEGEKVKPKFHLQIHLVKNSKHIIADGSGTCSDKPKDDIFNPKKRHKNVTCKFKDSPGKFEIKMSKSKDVLGVLSQDVRLKDISPGAQEGSVVNIPDGDLVFGLNRNKKIAWSTTCEEPLFRVYRDTIPRLWNEVALFAIRHDLARPTVTARNLYHMSSLMWDVYAAFDPELRANLIDEKIKLRGDVNKLREESMSYAAYYIIKHRYKNAPGNVNDVIPGVFEPDGPDLLINTLIDRIMLKLGYNLKVKPSARSSAAKFGFSMAKKLIAKTLNDNSRESLNYKAIKGAIKNTNKGLYMDFSQSGIKEPYSWNNTQIKWLGGKDIASIVDINHWLALSVPGSIDQGGNGQDNIQAPLTLFWGSVPTFGDLEEFKSPDKKGVYFDPGKKLLNFRDNKKEFIKKNLEVVQLSTLLNPLDLEALGKDFNADGKFDKNPGAEFIDISPAKMGNNTLGTNDGAGRKLNPFTAQPYSKNMVKRADFYRSLAEFWADGPASETPPGHWNTIANFVVDKLATTNSGYFWKGGRALSRQEYELKLYLTLNGALHDAAVVAWGIKGHYEGNRPITVIRKLAHMAQTDENFAEELLSYSSNLKMVEYTGTILSPDGEHLGEEKRRKLAIYAWRGHPFISELELRDRSFVTRNKLSRSEFDFYAFEQEVGGVGWIIAENWMPYQKTSFVTPPFPGFISGHSTFSRAAAEVLACVTGSEYFPGGIGKYPAPNLEFERTFKKSFNYHWATYYDAADFSGISRLYGGIHASYDDLPARVIGAKVGKRACVKSNTLF